MPGSLNDPIVDTVLRAPPSITTTTGGSQIPYPFPSPIDWRDEWIYFLLVDRFNNPTRPPRGADPYNDYQGGTFAGIRSKLSYLQNLGVGALWLSPVQMNPQWFHNYWGGYGVMDFLRIEPRFCANPDQALQDLSLADQEFRTLVDEAHEHGIYVILDIVLNHVGDLFNYDGARDSAPWNAPREYNVYWRDEQGVAQGNRMDIGEVPNLSGQEAIWPREFQRNDYFRRRGDYDPNGDITRGDFGRLKELVTEYLIPQTRLFPVRNLLIRACQYLIARFDLDGFRIDTLQYVEPEFARAFGNAMREYALSIGKKNFFTFGEVWQDDNETKIAEFVGRNTEKSDEFIGVDAAIDFPIRKRLVAAAKSFGPPSDLANHYDFRRETLKKIVSSHGEASGHYVTFLDNHDLNERFHNPQYADQTKLALTCLMTLQGIPCIYYGTEQGLDGNGDRREYVREALWGRPNAFSQANTLYQHLRELGDLRNQYPALRYGRQYFRPCSGNGTDFGYSTDLGGILAFSRILNDRELLMVANTSTTQTTTVHIAVDHNLHPEGQTWSVVFPFNWPEAAPGPTTTHGSYKTVQVALRPMTVQVLG